jgi:hypothetical protein
MKPTALAILLLAASTTLAQTNGGTGKGLDALDEQAVMAQLASSNLTTLLQRDFDNYKIPDDQKDQVMTLILLKQLTNPIGLNVSKRRELAVTVAHGLDQLSNRETDSSVLYEQTNELFLYGIVPTVTALEYFGENPAAQAQLKPVAETAKRLYAKVADLAKIKVDGLANQITDENKDTILPRINKFRMAQQYGEYSNNMATYAACISLRKTDPLRKSMADDTITYLQGLDNAQTGVQPTVRLQIGKLQLVKGSYAEAKATFDSIIQPADLNPPPDITQQNDARYFAIVAEMSARKLKDAATDIPRLENWQIQSYLPKLPNPADQASVKAALAMLKFRLYSAQSDLTNDVDEKTRTNNQAIDVLAGLVNDQPALKDLVYDQLVGRIPDQVDMTTLNPLTLIALEQQGIDEVLKKPEETVDGKKITKAISAAKEIVNRKGQTGVDDSAAERAAQFIAYGYDRLQQQKEAAGAFLDFAEKFPGDSVKAADALDHATALIGELRKKDRSTGEPDPDTRALYDRFLPIAINAPFNRKIFAFQYAALLQEEHKYKQAVDYFKQVPQTEKKYPQAQYLQMLALTQELGDENALNGDDRKAAVSQVLELSKVIEGFLTGATADADKKMYAGWVINGDEIAADLTRRELKDPASALKMLDGFEEKIAAAADADKAHIDALRLRIDCYRDMGDIDQATKALVTLMAANEKEGQELMFGVLKTVDNDMDTAKAAGNTADLKRLAQDRAQLSGFVVKWASNNKDPKVQQQLANYQMYDADSKREAAELMDDAAARKSGLEEALKEYKDLNSKNPDDPAAQLGIGLASFSLGHYQDAIDYLAPLMDKTQVLHPMKEVTENGMTRTVEDPQFWQANYERLESLVQLYNQNPSDPARQKDLSDANSYLGSLYIINGKKTGGTTYHDQFEKLKTEIAKLLGGAKK